ncbi:MAG: hypothetical protein M3Y82_15180 [Verrucomicrobiota bacterium]|nr:hypothetical protein [Verrucomicrobiota bacterium]
MDRVSGKTNFPWELLIVLGVGLLLLIILLFWAAFLRKRKRRHAKSHFDSSSVAKKIERSEKNSEKQRIKLRRRDHRPRNPTLSETGGLPPLKSDLPPSS